MQIQAESIIENYLVEITGNKKKIMKYIPLGISIPVLPEFRKYIIRNIERFDNVNSVLLKEEIAGSRFGRYTDDVVGHTLIFDNGKDTLFFGFFGVYDHDPDKIDFLIGQLIDIARKKNYSYIRGPINIPTNIFGMGFMQEGSSKELFICRPVTPPVYYKRFLENGFNIKFEEDQYRCNLFKFDPLDPKNPLTSRYDFSDYEFISMNSREQIMKCVDQIISLHTKFMPSSGAITPNVKGSAEDIVDIILEFGRPQYIWAVRHIPSNEIIAGGYVLPNIFSHNKNGQPDSLSMHHWVVHPEHRRKGITMFMYGKLSLELVAPGRGTFEWGIWPVGRDNTASVQGAIKMGGRLEKSFIILEKEM